MSFAKITSILYYIYIYTYYNKHPFIFYSYLYDKNLDVVVYKKKIITVLTPYLKQFRKRIRILNSFTRIKYETFIKCSRT